MITQSIDEILDALSARFGTTGAHLWEVLVRQQMLEAVSFVAMAVLTLSLGAWFFRLEQKRDNAWDDPFPTGLPAVALLVYGAVLTCIVIFQGIPSILNPEYYALKELLP